MASLTYRNQTTGKTEEVTYPYGVPLPKPGDAVISPFTGKVSDVVNLTGDATPHVIEIVDR
jgi:hypothetical protein